MNKQQEAMRLALEALESCQDGDYTTGDVLRQSFDEQAVNAAIVALWAALAQEQADPEQEPVAWMYIDKLGGKQAFANEPPPEFKAKCQPLYTAPPRCPNCASLEAQNTELDHKLAEMEQPNPQGCDHCNHPLYAATKCRVCGRVTERAEPVATVAETATTQQRVGETPPSDYRRGYWDGFAVGKREGRIEAEDAAKQAEPVAWLYAPGLAALKAGKWATAYGVVADEEMNIPLYTAPPQRKPLSQDLDAPLTLNGVALYPRPEPLSDEEIVDAFHAARNAKLGASQDNSKHRLSVVEIARAIERAHGIGGQE